MKKIFIILALIQHISYAQDKAWEQDAAPLHRAQKGINGM
jgi:hypothetical protein